MSGKQKVAAVRCARYDQELIGKQLNLLMTAIGADTLIQPGMNVLIKPNLLSAKTPEEFTTTHPEVLRALIRYVHNRGGIVTLADSPAGRFTLDSIRRIYQKTGLRALAQEEQCLPEFADIDIVFDATSAGAHVKNDAALREAKPDIRLIDLTPAAIGPYCVPVVNLEANVDQLNVNMVTCGGQATIPMVAAVSRVARVHYAEIIASIASKSAGPGTRANIDEFTETTSRAIEVVGGAAKGKAIIVLNPAEPPLMMRDTVYVLSDEASQDDIEASINEMAEAVQAYVPGYRLKQRVQFEVIPQDKPVNLPGVGQFSGLKTAVWLEVEGAAHYLPAYAGNLDIMTSSALATAEKMAQSLARKAGEAA